MPQTRSIRPRRSQIIWLVVIVAVGVTVGVLAGAWWGVGAAAILLAISEVIERVQALALLTAPLAARANRRPDRANGVLVGS